VQKYNTSLELVEQPSQKCTKFDFGWGSTPDPAGGAYRALLDSLAGFKGPTSKGKEGKGKGRKGTWKAE